MKILHQAEFETAWEAVALAKPRALTIAPCPSLFGNYRLKRKEAHANPAVSG